MIVLATMLLCNACGSRDPVGTIVPLVYRRFEAGMDVWISTVCPNRQNTTLNWRTKGGKNEKTDSNIDSGNAAVIVSWNCGLRSYQR
jgi:hypothetical protein